MPLTTERLLAPVADDAPCGPDLEYDADYGALARAAEGKPERQSGEATIAAEEPDWREVETLAEALLARSRDLRVLVHLAHARLHRAGLAAFAETLEGARALLAARWDTVHPQLDPDDDNDPIGRKNALAGLAHPRRVMRVLRHMPLTTTRGALFGWRDIALASGRLPAEEDGRRPALEAVRAAFTASDAPRVAGLRAAAQLAAAALAGITAVFDDRAGSGSGPDFDDLAKVLREIALFIGQYAPPPEAPAAVTSDDPTASVGGTDHMQVSGRQAIAPAAPAPARLAEVSEITNRADALRMLALATEYFRRAEPSSPLPLLLDRALRLADMAFLDILRDLAPDGLSQARNVAGVRDRERDNEFD